MMWSTQSSWGANETVSVPDAPHQHTDPVWEASCGERGGPRGAPCFASGLLRRPGPVVRLCFPLATPAVFLIRRRRCARPLGAEEGHPGVWQGVAAGVSPPPKTGSWQGACSFLHEAHPWEGPASPNTSVSAFSRPVWVGGALKTGASSARFLGLETASVGESPGSFHFRSQLALGGGPRCLGRGAAAWVRPFLQGGVASAAVSAGLWRPQFAAPGGARGSASRGRGVPWCSLAAPPFGRSAPAPRGVVAQSRRAPWVGSAVGPSLPHGGGTKAPDSRRGPRGGAGALFKRLVG